MIVLAGPNFGPSPKIMASLRFVNGKSFCRTKFRFYFPGWRDSAKLARFRMFIDLCAQRGAAMKSFWPGPLLILLLHFPCAVMVQAANSANDSLEKLAADFWTW